jgi:hypothetical protein
MATYVVGGVEKIELAPAFFTEAGVSTAVWTQVEYIAPDTVVYTKNADTETDLVPEDKDTAFITFYTPGEADTIAFGILQQYPTIMAMLFNQEYVAATSKTTILAKRKVANLAIKITTRSMKDGRKQTIVMPNVAFTTTFVNNLSKTTVQQLLLTGKVQSFKTTTTLLDAIVIKTFITEANAVIDSTTP